MIGRKLKSPMRKGQLIRAVIKAYKDHIKHIQENFKEGEMESLSSYIYAHEISHGICLFIHNKTRYPYAGYRAKWVEKYCNPGNNKWGKYPCTAETVQEVVKALELRVQNMEKELASGDKLHQRVTSENYSKCE